MSQREKPDLASPTTAEELEGGLKTLDEIRGEWLSKMDESARADGQAGYADIDEGMRTSQIIYGERTDLEASS